MATTTDDKPGTNGHASNGSRGKRRSSLMQAAVALPSVESSLEDFIARLFNIENAVQQLAARHHELAPLYFCKRQFVQRRAKSKVSDEELAKSAVDETGKGKLCMARVFEATAAVKVYRVWNSQKTYTEFGKWWSFAKPSGPVATYREQNAICPEWSDLDRLTVCEIKVGARFAIGPGQSATCASTAYAKSSVNQVYIPNDTRENKVFVDHCEQLGPWP